MKPFVKWVGGKTQLLKYIDKIMPEYDRIVEPFVGGGAFFIHNKSDKNLINDINLELIISNQVIKNYPHLLMSKLKKYEQQHSESFFYELRNFNINELSKEDPISQILIASRFIYLNKSGYNGLYRVNSDGKFNVPFGKKEKISTFNENNILELSRFFNEKKVIMKNEPFQNIFKLAKKGDLFFIDPPYDFEEKKSFTEYNKNNFGKEKQIILRNLIDELNNKGINFILTNHDTKFIDELYTNSNYKKIKVDADRMINSNKNNRIKSAKEIIIFNF